MLAMVPHVTEARVIVDGEAVGEIGNGLLALVCAERDHTLAEADKMDRSVHNVGGSILVVSQFTLAAEPSHGCSPCGASSSLCSIGASYWR